MKRVDFRCAFLLGLQIFPNTFFFPSARWNIMANPEHTPEMASLDRLTVVLYRSGLSLFALSSALEAAELLSGVSILGRWHLPLTAAGAAIASANIHLYDPRFRWFFPLMSWLGLIVLAFTLPVQSPEIAKQLSVFSLAFFYAGAGMFAVKEYFCFRIPGLQLMPLLLAGAVLLRWSGLAAAEGTFLAVAALLYLWLAWAKWRMPLHFDIGDKSMYTM
ncbi:Putative integral membrane protein [Candidatus Electronema aureum]